MKNFVLLFLSLWLSLGAGAQVQFRVSMPNGIAPVPAGGLPPRPTTGLPPRPVTSIGFQANASNATTDVRVLTTVKILASGQTASQSQIASLIIDGMPVAAKAQNVTVSFLSEKALKEAIETQRRYSSAAYNNNLPFNPQMSRLVMPNNKLEITCSIQGGRTAKDRGLVTPYGVIGADGEHVYQIVKISALLINLQTGETVGAYSTPELTVFDQTDGQFNIQVNPAANNVLQVLGTLIGPGRVRYQQQKRQTIGPLSLIRRALYELNEKTGAPGQLEQLAMQLPIAEMIQIDQESVRTAGNGVITVSGIDVADRTKVYLDIRGGVAEKGDGLLIPCLSGVLSVQVEEFQSDGQNGGTITAKAEGEIPAKTRFDSKKQIKHLPKTVVLQ